MFSSYRPQHCHFKHEQLLCCNFYECYILCCIGKWNNNTFDSSDGSTWKKDWLMGFIYACWVDATWTHGAENKTMKNVLLFFTYRKKNIPDTKQAVFRHYMKIAAYKSDPFIGMAFQDSDVFIFNLAFRGKFLSFFRKNKCWFSVELKQLKCYPAAL